MYPERRCGDRVRLSRPRKMCRPGLSRSSVPSLFSRDRPSASQAQHDCTRESLDGRRRRRVLGPAGPLHRGSRDRSDEPLPLVRPYKHQDKYESAQEQEQNREENGFGRHGDRGSPTWEGAAIRTCAFRTTALRRSRGQIASPSRLSWMAHGDRVRMVMPLLENETLGRPICYPGCYASGSQQPCHTPPEHW